MTMTKNYDMCAFRVIMPTAAKAEHGADVSFKIQFADAVHEVYLVKCSVSDRFGKKYEADFAPVSNGKNNEKMHRYAVAVEAEKAIYTTEGKLELELLDMNAEQKIDIVYTIKRSGPMVLEQVETNPMEEQDKAAVRGEGGERPRRRRRLSYMTRQE